MQNSILNTEIQNFIDSNINTDVTQLALKKNPFPEVEWTEILNQIVAKKKAIDKLPTFFNAKNIIFPNKISIEQTSSEITALYKSEIVSGSNLIDLTGGFGIDCFYFSKKIENVFHCEINEDLSKIVQHNFKTLQIANIKCFADDGLNVLTKSENKFDWIYVDPSRRNESKGKVFMLQDCTPNIAEFLPTYFEYADNILIKTAPILDISSAMSEISNVKEIHIVAINNEVKELNWVLKKSYSGLVFVKTINFIKNAVQKFDFEMNESTSSIKFELPEAYLYEPNAAIMKSGGFYAIAKHYNLNKLHPHSHLYTSSKLIQDFPGRIFIVKEQFEFNKNNMKTFLEHKKINITTRNFPETVESIRKKWKIKDGGNDYCFFTTNIKNEKIVILCTKTH